MQKKHCKLDKNGELVTKEKSDEVTFKSKEDKMALTAAINEINNTECELPIRIDVYKRQQQQMARSAAMGDFARTIKV